MKIFKEADFYKLYSSIMKDGYFSKGAGDMWEPNTRPNEISDLANEILTKHIIERDGSIYVESGVVLNGEKLYRKVGLK